MPRFRIRYAILSLEQWETYYRGGAISTCPTARDGGYDLEDLGDGRTKVTIFNTLEGHGFGKVLQGFAVKAAQRDAGAFAQRIKVAVEAS